MFLEFSEFGLADAATKGQSFGLTAVRGFRDLRTLNVLSFNQLSYDERLQLLTDNRTPTPEWNPDDSEAREARQEDEIRLGENPSTPSTSQSLTSANSSMRTLLAAALHRAKSLAENGSSLYDSIVGAGIRLGARIRQNIIDDLTDIRSEVDLIARSIGYVESRGRYNVIGPRTRDGDHAYGKYQVMGKYVGDWTEKAIGRRLTPQEFLNDPKAQDAVAHQRMGDLYRRHGNLQDVAAVWFSGRPLRHNTSRDVTGVSVPLYAQLAQAHHDRLVEAMAARGIQLASFEPTKPAGAKPLRAAERDATGGSVVATGDSIAHGLVGVQGIQDGGTRVGRSPAEVLQTIRANLPLFRGKQVILSTGSVNNPAQMDCIQRQIQELHDAGAANIIVLGAGNRADIMGVNGRLREIVDGFRGINVQFTGPINPQLLSADHIHPSNYGDFGKGILRLLVQNQAPRPPLATHGKIRAAPVQV